VLKSFDGWNGLCAILSDGICGVSININKDSAYKALNSWNLISAMLKWEGFGLIVSVVS